MTSNSALKVVNKYGNGTWTKATAIDALNEYIEALVVEGDEISALHASGKTEQSPLKIQSFIYNATLKREGLGVI